MMQMNGNLTNTELPASAKFDMKNPVVFEALAVPVVVDVCAGDGDVVDIEGGTLGQTTHDRLSNSIVESSVALYDHIFIIVIDSHSKVTKIGVSSQSIDLLILVQRECGSLGRGRWLFYRCSFNIFKSITCIQ